MRAPLASTLVWAAWAFILVLVIAALAALLFALLTGVPRSPCTSGDAETLPETTVEALLAEGWYAGDPADGAERLYSPGCRVPAK